MNEKETFFYDLWKTTVQTKPNTNLVTVKRVHAKTSNKIEKDKNMRHFESVPSRKWLIFCALFCILFYFGAISQWFVFKVKKKTLNLFYFLFINKTLVRRPTTGTGSVTQSSAFCKAGGSENNKHNNSEGLIKLIDQSISSVVMNQWTNIILRFNCQALGQLKPNQAKIHEI